MKRFIPVIAAALVVGWALGAAWMVRSDGLFPQKEPPAPAVPPAEPGPPPPLYATLASVGDVFFGQTPLRHARDPETGEYDFTPSLEHVKALISAADLAVANLEEPVAGEDLGGYTGYPMFNAPDALLAALKDAGFDVLTNANNHALDRGERGVLRTNDALDRFGFVHTGTARSQAERDAVTMVEVNGIKLAFTAYSYGTNGIPVPHPYLINLLDEKLMRSDIARAREAGADLVAVALHFGNEYEVAPDARQEALVDRLLDAGADIVLGHHPHVLQRAELRGEGRLKKAVLFSQGNFLCSQVGEDRLTSAIFYLDLEKDQVTGAAGVTAIRFKPVYIHAAWVRGRLTWRALPAAEAAADPAAYDVPRGHVPILQRAVERATARLAGAGVERLDGQPAGD